MVDWYNNLDFVLQIYWGVAIFSGALFIVQTIMTFVGMDSGGDIDIDTDVDVGSGFHIDSPFDLFTVRNMINFLLGFGWAGVCFYSVIGSLFWLNLLAIIVGLVFVALFFLIVKQFLKLSVDNTFKIADAVGKTADVYLSIPAAKSGKGKIHVSVAGAIHELGAMTEGDRIPTGAKATIGSLIDNQTVMVVPF